MAQHLVPGISLNIPDQYEVEIKRKLDEELKEYQQAASNEEADEELHDSSIEE